ncbi:putative dehydrogenase [Cryobacterium sp. MP_M5]|uniref:Gfo/Idh/MocA family protein n=1 Tax=unclassified Cryobacterium TaxID=2649013 RepID=UPI0018CB1EFD|nr:MULTISPECIES: Gfo/Idh/MocA family oxidoreductase [unclassified Cryobacterium]MBG6058116.1 putative dehydrogenase [Cryobacterium sp. MP_M3]MEC5176640.1 putative dehydrogenase [Cryobacterium sp. MP_M5]
MLRIGILGAAGIAPAAIIRPARRRTDAVIAAVASRRATAAAAFALEHGIDRSYGDYQALLADPSIDLVYVALPPSEHAEWSIAAMEAGKDVLCEKPFALNSAQALRMRAAAAATGRRLIEAFHDRYHPLSLELDLIKASGRLGEIVSLQADFSGSNPFDPLSIRHDPALGGGSLMDLGCYPVHWVRALIGEEPTVTDAFATLNPLGADLSMDARLLFPSGVTARVTSSMIEGTPLNTSLDIIGTRGTVHVDNLVFPSTGHSIREEIDGITRSLTVRGAETYDHQLDAIIRGLAGGEPLPTEGDDPVGNMTVIDAIYAAAGLDRSNTQHRSA